MEKNVNLKKIKRKTIIDKLIRYLFMAVAILCAFIIVFLACFIFVKGLTPFIKSYQIDGQAYKVNFFDFLTGLTWKSGVGDYGVGYIIIDTILVTLFSLVIAVPISILSALFISKIAPKGIAKVLNSVIELLSSIPSVIYGLFGVGVITTFVKKLSEMIGYQSAGGMSMLSASIVLAIMILPTITLLSITALNTVNNNLINGSLALGASKTQTNFKVVLTSAKSGIFSGIILGVGRALGEATAVSLVCGNAGSGPTFHPFDITKTLTSAMLQGINETSGLDYDIRFSVGIILIVIIFLTNFGLNVIKNRIGKKNG